MFFSKGAQQASGDWGKALSDIPEEQSYTAASVSATTRVTPSRGGSRLRPSSTSGSGSSLSSPSDSSSGDGSQSDGEATASSSHGSHGRTTATRAEGSGRRGTSTAGTARSGASHKSSRSRARSIQEANSASLYHSAEEESTAARSTTSSDARRRRSQHSSGESQLETASERNTPLPTSAEPSDLSSENSSDSSSEYTTEGSDAPSVRSQERRRGAASSAGSGAPPVTPKAKAAVLLSSVLEDDAETVVEEQEAGSASSSWWRWPLPPPGVSASTVVVVDAQVPPLPPVATRDQEGELARVAAKPWWERSTGDGDVTAMARALAAQQKQHTMVQARIHAGMKSEYAERTNLEDVWNVPSSMGDRAFRAIEFLSADGKLKERHERRPRSSFWRMLIVSHQFCQMCHTAVYLGLIYMMFSDISLNIVEQSQEVGSVHGDLEKAEPYLVATAVVAGLFWAPYVNALQYFAIGRIESLAYVFPWDFAQWQVIASFVVLPTCFYMVEESLLAFGLAVGGWSNDQLDPVYRETTLVLELGFLVSLFVALPGYVLHWTSKVNLGTTVRMYDWQKKVPYTGRLTQLAYSALRHRARFSAENPCCGMGCEVTRPWGLPNDRPFIDMIDQVFQVQV